MRKMRWQRSDTVILGGIIVLLSLALFGFRLNVQPSLPYGVYRLRPVPHVLPLGALVLFQTPASMRPWRTRWFAVLKPIAGRAGDAVCITDDGLWIQSVWYGPVLTEAAGKRLPALRGCFVVGSHEVVVASRALRSMDSRYFGAVPVKALTALAVPVWTW